MFAPNVRGSSGFGKPFVIFDNGSLRFDGVKDSGSCVDYLVANRIADPKRVGITGGSYGGYMTMVGVTFFRSVRRRRDLFGIVNFLTFFEQTEPWMAAISTMEDGDPVTQANLLASLSPIRKLDAHYTADGPARRQRHERPSRRGRADRREPEVGAACRSIHLVSGRGSRLAEGPEPHPLRSGRRRVLRQAPGRVGAEQEAIGLGAALNDVEGRPCLDAARAH